MVGDAMDHGDVRAGRSKVNLDLLSQLGQGLDADGTGARSKRAAPGLSFQVETLSLFESLLTAGPAGRRTTVQGKTIDKTEGIPA